MVLDSPRPLSLAAIARATDQNRATTYRILRTLVYAGYLSSDPDEPVYSPGPALARFLHGSALEAALHRSTMPLLEELAALSEETVALFVPSWPDLICVACVLSRHPVRRHHDVGDVTAMSRAAPGRAYLAFTPPSHVEAVLRQRPLMPSTKRSVSSEDRLYELLRQVAARGYAMSESETNEGMSGIAAPLFAAGSDLPVAVVSVSGPTFRWGQERLTRFAPQLLDAIARAQSRDESERLGKPAKEG